MRLIVKAGDVITISRPGFSPDSGLEITVKAIGLLDVTLYTRREKITLSEGHTLNFFDGSLYLLKIRDAESAILIPEFGKLNIGVRKASL